MERLTLTAGEAAAFLREHDNYLILTHRRPDGDTLGCAAGLCHMLRGIGKTAALLYNREVTERYAPYVSGLWAAKDYAAETVVSVDVADLKLLPEDARELAGRIELAFDHHPTYAGFARRACVRDSCAACGELLWEVAAELGRQTAEVALPLYVAVSTDTGCFVYSNVNAATHRVAAELIETGIDFRAVNKKLFRTKSKKRLALEGKLLRELEFFDRGRIVVVQVPRSLIDEMSLTENDMDDLSALGGLVEGQDCAITMKERENGDWKISVRTGPRIDASKVCMRFGGGGHRSAAGCSIGGMSGEEAKQAVVAACVEAGGDA